MGEAKFYTTTSPKPLNQKTKFPECGVICMILCLATLVQYKFVRDGQIEEHMIKREPQHVPY